LIPTSQAAAIFDLAQNGFTLTNTNADGSVIKQTTGFIITGGNNGSGQPGTTDLVALATGTGMVQFQYSYASLDLPTFDFAGYLLNNSFFSLADTDGQAGKSMFPVSAGQSFGFRVGTADNTGEPGILTVTSGASPVPEPGTGSMLFAALIVILGTMKFRRVGTVAPVGFGVLLTSALFGQTQFHYAGSNVTGQLLLSTTVNLVQQTQTAAIKQSGSSMQQMEKLSSQIAKSGLPEVKPNLGPTLLPPLPVLSSTPKPSASKLRTGESTINPRTFRLLAAQPAPAMHSLIVSPSSSFGFLGLTHFDQRNANGGNQFSIEPPSQGLAVGNGFVMEGVNNAVQVYSLSGAPQLPKVLATNQVFGVAPAINRSTGVNGVYPTDIRVFYDQTISRWFVLQRAQANDAAGNLLPQSREYIAVSQTGDPTGTYNVYTIDTTNANAQHPGCPCISDYPQIGADQYGFYVSSAEYPVNSSYPIDSTILAISKAALASGASSPTAYEFVVPVATGFEFAIQPATTPPGASYFTASGGLEYFVSSIAMGDSNLAVWAMNNTSSLATANPNPALTRITVPALAYTLSNNAVQRPGPLPYGSTLSPPQSVPVPLDSSDCRVESVVYSGGRLYATLGTQVVDENNRVLAGGAYVVFSPTFRGALAAPILRQDYLLVKNNNLLRPAIGVNSLGRGAIVFTLVGPDYFPSAAFVPVDAFSTGTTVQITGPGVFPEDGFSGYSGRGYARWGDYSAAVVDSDGSIWMGTEYIPNAPRTQLANWGTFLIRYTP